MKLEKIRDKYIYFGLLVTMEVGGGLASALPFDRRRTVTKVAKAWRFRPDPGVQYSDDDVAFNLLYTSNVFCKTHEIPWSCGVKMLLSIQKYRDHTLLGWSDHTQNYQLISLEKFVTLRLLLELQVTYQQSFELLLRWASPRIRWNFACSCGVKLRERTC